jgi:tryptophan-rich hypothetical protein
MNPVNPKKLLQSIWTAVAPRTREKYFLVTAVRYDEEGAPQTCILEAIHSQRETELGWRELKNAGQRLMSWK